MTTLPGVIEMATSVAFGKSCFRFWRKLVELNVATSPEAWMLTLTTDM